MSQISANLFARSVYDKTASDKLAAHLRPSLFSRGLYDEFNAAYKTKLIDKHIADLSKKYARYAKEGLPVDGIERKIRAIEKTKPARYVGQDVRESLDKNLLPDALDSYKAKPWNPDDIPTAVELWEKAKRIKPHYDRWGYQDSWTIPRVYFLDAKKFMLPGPEGKLPG